MTVYVIISGFVQGVGFRHFVKVNARSLGVKGWIKNLSSGEVEAIFQADKENIEHLIEICRKGPFLSEVKKIAVEKINSSDKFDKFEVVK